MPATFPDAPLADGGSTAGQCLLTLCEAARWLGVTRTTKREDLARFGSRPVGEPSEQP